MKSWRFMYDRYLASGDARRAERLIELVTMGLAILLLVELLLSGLRLAILSTPEAIPPSMDGLADAQLMSVQRVSPSQSDEIRARPLFWISRRPLAGAVAGAGDTGSPAANPGSLEKVKLVGLFGSGETAGIIAIIDQQKRRVLLGGQVEGWTLDSIQRNTVEFTNGARREKLVLLPENDVAAPLRAAGGLRAPAPDPGRGAGEGGAKGVMERMRQGNRAPVSDHSTRGR
jgi:hypothetical protein